MTVCYTDTTPDDWHKMGFSSAYLGVVGNYIKTHGVIAKISGAISYGVLGPAESKVSFEDKVAFDAFVEWFSLTDEPPMSGCIFIADESLYAPQEERKRGSRVTELPKSGSNLFEKQWAKTKEALMTGRSK